MPVSRTLRRRYRLTAEIGRGGSGAVFLAADQRLQGRECAIKEIRLPEEPDAAAEARATLTAEAQILTRLDHAALPKVSDFFVAEGAAYLVMDHVAGQDLRSVVADAWRRDRPLSEEQVLAWGTDMCDVLTYLHRQSPPVVHRDVKPGNIKLTPDGRIKLVDFGLARPVATGDGRTVTVLGDAGSRPYQPLEQYGDGQAIGPRSDIYALGATLYHLLSGRAPASAQARFLHDDSLEPLDRLRPGLHPATVRGVKAAMALHPDDRPASARELKSLLSAESAARAAPWSDALRANVWLIATVLVLFLAALAMSLGS